MLTLVKLAAHKPTLLAIKKRPPTWRIDGPCFAAFTGAVPAPKLCSHQSKRIKNIVN